MKRDNNEQQARTTSNKHHQGTCTFVHSCSMIG